MSAPEHAEAFEWDDDELETSNTAHLARHGVRPHEAEQVFYNQGVLARNKRRSTGDWLLVGVTDGGRRLTLVLNYQAEKRTIRFITGWDSTADEIKRYR
jgi:uncharacterized DUF497 family protein